MVKPILVIGATGKQGGSVIRNLLANPTFSPSEYPIYAVTRNTSSPSAQRLAAQSPAIQLVAGDLNDVTAIFTSLPARPWGVYAMTNPGKGETEQGNALVDEAAAAGVSHFVFSSVDRGSADGGFRPSKVPHFITKHEIEAHLRAVVEKSGGKMTYTVIRPPFFMDNLEPGFFGKVVASVWKDYTKKPIIMVDTKDIGKVAAASFMEPQNAAYKNNSISFAGDRLTFEEANDIFRENTGKPIPTTFTFFAWLLLTLSHDMNAMVEFWNTEEFGADVKESRAKYGVITFKEWVQNSAHASKKTGGA